MEGANQPRHPVWACNIIGAHKRCALVDARPFCDINKQHTYESSTYPHHTSWHRAQLRAAKIHREKNLPALALCRRYFERGSCAPRKIGRNRSIFRQRPPGFARTRCSRERGAPEFLRCNQSACRASCTFITQTKNTL